MKNMFKIAVLVLASAIAQGAQAAGDIEAGKVAAQKSNCFTCHGQDYNTPIDPSYPKLAGQHKDYLENAMIAYQRGTSGLSGRGNAIMAGQAKQLSKKDIQNIAAYLHSLPGTLVVRK
ncbi:c-type cytochrome [Noviherbaspirillum sedimenti]|uniref:Cytochrome c n=1 Tax=Noviherbaspirillum sedimenti TaxID=2320865 RepID=A0A3A3GL18_9BURK|nr:cytochrome c [Noviherbaspirillum sedimenti]RJG01660.1 cytochrome c [Noviherbaspirillum sedimenti]